MPYEIETGVPLKDGRGGGKGELRFALEALARAEIGASIFVPAGTFKDPASVRVRAHFTAGPGWFSCRKVEGGQRIWKIAEPGKPQRTLKAV